MEAILAQRFAFYDFSDVIGFPNPIPSRDEWEGTLPTFKGGDWEVPAEHLLDFHEFIHERQIVHEDVKIKLFRYSLKGAALDWCRSLPASSINSLASFHNAFNIFCKEDFSAESLFENCCDEFDKHIQQKENVSSDCKNENHVVEEDFPNLIDNRKDDCIVVNALDFVSDAPVVLDLNEKIVEEEVFPQLLQVDSYNMLLHVIKEENQEVAHQEQIYEAAYGNVRFDQQVYENIMPIFHVQSEPVYGSIEQQAEVTIFSYQSTSFYDLVAIYVDLCFSEDFSLAIFGIKSDEGCRYVLQIKIMLHIKNSSLISICVERALVNGLMLSWLHWKHDVT
jgi:hypothetical protein